MWAPAADAAADAAATEKVIQPVRLASVAKPFEEKIAFDSFAMSDEV